MRKSIQRLTLTALLTHAALLSAWTITPAQQVPQQPTPETYFRSGLESQRIGRYEESVEAYRRSIQLKPDFAEAHFNLSTVLTTLGKFDEAVAELNQVIALKPDFATAYFNLACVYSAQGKDEDAIKALEKATQLSPDWEAARVALGTLLGKTGFAQKRLNLIDLL
jgi:tetratricopeptide (TPR) repeat protein